MATKENLIRNHLIEHRMITSWEAIENYGATRLASVIYNLRKEGFLINSYDFKDHDRHGNICIYSRNHRKRVLNKMFLLRNIQ